MLRRAFDFESGVGCRAVLGQLAMPTDGKRCTFLYIETEEEPLSRAESVLSGSWFEVVLG